MPLEKEQKSVSPYIYTYVNISSSDCLTVGMNLLELVRDSCLPHTVCTSEQQQLASAVGESAVEIIKRLQRSCSAARAPSSAACTKSSLVCSPFVKCCADGGFAIMLSRVRFASTHKLKARNTPFFRVLLFGPCVFHLKCVMLSKSLLDPGRFYLCTQRARWTSSDSLNQMNFSDLLAISFTVQQRFLWIHRIIGLSSGQVVCIQTTVTYKLAEVEFSK